MVVVDGRKKRTTTRRPREPKPAWIVDGGLIRPSSLTLAGPAIAGSVHSVRLWIVRRDEKAPSGEEPLHITSNQPGVCIGRREEGILGQTDATIRCDSSADPSAFLSVLVMFAMASLGKVVLAASILEV